MERDSIRLPELSPENVQKVSSSEYLFACPKLIQLGIVRNTQFIASINNKITSYTRGGTKEEGYFLFLFCMCDMITKNERLYMYICYLKVFYNFSRSAGIRKRSRCCGCFSMKRFLCLLCFQNIIQTTLFFFYI